MRPRVTVVIPTWNGAELLDRCLRSLGAQSFQEMEIIVVDNGSTDGTDLLLEAQFPDVRTIRFPDNRGFAPAVNIGIERARGDIIVLLNNDMQVEPLFVASLTGELDRDPGLASCAARVLIADVPGSIDSIGARVGLFPSQIGHGKSSSDPAFEIPADVLAPSGGAAAYRKDALEAVGGFDDRFFAYFEDADLGCRLRLAGYRCRYVPGAVAYHEGSATSRRVPEWKFYLLMRNGLFVFFQNMPLRRLLPWAPVVLLWPFVRAVIDRVRPTVAVRAVWDFLRDVPTVLERRRRVKSLRRIPWSEFVASLAPPWSLSRQPLLPDMTPTPDGGERPPTADSAPRSPEHGP